MSYSTLYKALLIFLLFCLAIPELLICQEKIIPESMLCSPVLVSAFNGTGSGVFMSDSTKIYFVTARHVIFLNDSAKIKYLAKTIKLLYYPKKIDDKYAVMNIDLSTPKSDTLIRFSKIYDVAVILIGRKHTQGNQSYMETVKEVSIYNGSEGITGQDVKNSRKYSQTNIGADVYLFGYPQSIGMQQIPQFDYTKPLLRKGIVAGKYEKNKTIVLDCPSYFGNSGGPVFQISDEIFHSDAYIIGIMSQYIPFIDQMQSNITGASNVQVTNSGYSIITPIEYAIDLMKEFK
jgi:hypothetical protein